MAVLISFAGGGVGSLGNAEQVGGWVSEVRFLLKRECESRPIEAFSMWASGPRTLASFPLGMLVQLYSASQILFQELGTLWGLSPGSGQGTHRESLFRLGLTRKRGFQKLTLSLLLLSPLLPKSTSSICTVLDIHPRGPGDKNSDPRVTLPGPTAPVSLLAARAG